MEFGRTLAGIAEILAERSPETVLENGVRILAEASGAAAAAILVFRKESVHRQYWHSPDASLREALVDPFVASALSLAPLEGSHIPATASASAALGTCRHGGTLFLLRALPFDGAEDRRATVCLAFSDTGAVAPDDSALLPLVQIVSRREETARRVVEYRSEKARHERWFRTLDAQLRVLDRERQKFVAVVGQSDTYMLVVDADHVVKWTNTAMGGKLEELGRASSWIDRPQSEVWESLRYEGPPPRSRRCPVARAFRENAVVHQEMAQSTGDETRNLYLTAMPIKGPDGTPDEVLVMIQDVTDLEVLRRSEARYRSLFERSPDAMVMFEPETQRILLANPVASALTGYEPEELTRHFIEILHDPSEWERVGRLYERVFAEDEPVSSETVVLTRAGKRRIANLTAARFDLDGKAVVLAEFQDVTEKKRLQDELRHTGKMEAIGRLAGGVAHDFNNILTIIMGHSEMLVSRLQEDERIAGIAKSVHKAAVRGSLLTRQLLAFSRKDVLKSEVLDLRDVVEGIEAMLRSLIGEKVELATTLGAAPCLVRADRSHLDQIVMNLVVNARDAMPPRGGNIWVEVYRTDDPGRKPDPRFPVAHAVLVVRDDGKGIDSRIQSRLFEPFFTTKEQGKGTGLGLSSVYAIIKDCGGEIEVSSKLGQGTTFTIHIPLAEGQSKSAPLESMVCGVYAPGSETILVVEDEEEVRALACEVLEIAGYSVLSASSGEEALGLLNSREQPIQLLLSDVIMPGMSGGEFVRRATETGRPPKVLYMSGYSDDDLVQHGVSGSEAWFIQKPFTLEALTDKVREVLDAGHPGRT